MGVPVLHGLSDLVTPAPGSRITQTQVSLNLAGRRACCPGGHQKDGPKPVSQGLPGLVKDGIGSKGCLMPTTFALIEPSVLYYIGLMMTTPGTPKTIRPFLPDQIPKAIPLCAESPFELMGAHDIIHGPPPDGFCMAGPCILQ